MHIDDKAILANLGRTIGVLVAVGLVLVFVSMSIS